MYQDLVKSDPRHLTIFQRISQTHVDTYLTSQQLLATSGHLPNCRSGDAHVYVYIYICVRVCVCSVHKYTSMQHVFVRDYVHIIHLCLPQHHFFFWTHVAEAPFSMQAVSVSAFCIRVQRQCSARRQTPGPAIWRAPSRNGASEIPPVFCWIFWCILLSLVLDSWW